MRGWSRLGWFSFYARQTKKQNLPLSHGAMHPCIPFPFPVIVSWQRWFFPSSPRWHMGNREGFGLSQDKKEEVCKLCQSCWCNPLFLWSSWLIEGYSLLLFMSCSPYSTSTIVIWITAVCRQDKGSIVVGLVLPGWDNLCSSCWWSVLRSVVRVGLS